MSIDLSNSYDSASSRLNAFKTYIEVSKAERKARRDAANSTSKSVVNTATQLDKSIGGDAANGIDSTTASLNRLKNAFTQSMSGGAANSLFNVFIQLINQV
jgi:hypothetical protein